MTKVYINYLTISMYTVNIVKPMYFIWIKIFFFSWVWPDGPDRPLGNLHNIFHQLANQF